MHVTATVKLPIDLANRFKEMLETLSKEHAKEEERTKARAKVVGDPEVYAQERERLSETSKRLTIANLMRLALEQGYASLKAHPAEKLVEKIRENGIPLGRARGS